MEARDLRAKARELLQGKWGRVYLIAVICALPTLVFQIAAAVYLYLSGITYNINNYQTVINYYTSYQYVVYNLIGIFGMMMSGFFAIALTAAYLKITNNEKPEMSEFPQLVKRGGESGIYMLVMGFKIFFWTLLFIIPGIIKAIAYAMGIYIKTENKKISISEALKQSQDMMRGNKGRFVYLCLTFLGWFIVAGLAAGVISGIIGIFASGASLFITPVLSAAASTVVSIYLGVTTALFYKDLKGRPMAGTNTQMNNE